MAKHWMQEAFANSHGQFRAKARRANMSTKAYARRHEHDSGKTGRQAQLALRGMEANHKGKKGDGKTAAQRLYH